MATKGAAVSSSGGKSSTNRALPGGVGKVYIAALIRNAPKAGSLRSARNARLRDERAKRGLRSELLFYEELSTLDFVGRQIDEEHNLQNKGCILGQAIDEKAGDLYVMFHVTDPATEKKVEDGIYKEISARTIYSEDGSTWADSAAVCKKGAREGTQIYPMKQQGKQYSFRIMRDNSEFAIDFTPTGRGIIKSHGSVQLQNNNRIVAMSQSFPTPSIDNVQFSMGDLGGGVGLGDGSNVLRLNTANVSGMIGGDGDQGHDSIAAAFGLKPKYKSASDQAGPKSGSARSKAQANSKNIEGDVNGDLDDDVDDDDLVDEDATGSTFPQRDNHEDKMARQRKRAKGGDQAQRGGGGGDEKRQRVDKAGAAGDADGDVDMDAEADEQGEDGDENDEEADDGPEALIRQIQNSDKYDAKSKKAAIALLRGQADDGAKDATATGKAGAKGGDKAQKNGGKAGGAATGQTSAELKLIMDRLERIENSSRNPSLLTGLSDDESAGDLTDSGVNKKGTGVIADSKGKLQAMGKHMAAQARAAAVAYAMPLAKLCHSIAPEIGSDQTFLKSLVKQFEGKAGPAEMQNVLTGLNQVNNQLATLRQENQRLSEIESESGDLKSELEEVKEQLAAERRRKGRAGPQPVSASPAQILADLHKQNRLMSGPHFRSRSGHSGMGKQQVVNMSKEVAERESSQHRRQLTAGLDLEAIRNMSPDYFAKPGAKNSVPMSTVDGDHLDRQMHYASTRGVPQ